MTKLPHSDRLKRAFHSATAIEVKVGNPELTPFPIVLECIEIGGVATVALTRVGFTPRVVACSMAEDTCYKSLRQANGSILRRALTQLLRRESRHGEMKFSVEVHHLLSVAESEAFELNHKYIGTEHFLLASLRVESIIQQRLVELGIFYDAFRGSVCDILKSGKSF